MIQTEGKEKRKISESSSDESYDSNHNIDEEPENIESSQSYKNAEDSNIHSYFRELQFCSENQDRSKKDRKYSQQHLSRLQNNIKADFNVTQEFKLFPKTNQTFKTTKQILKLIQEENGALLKSIQHKILKNGFTKSQFFSSELLITEITHSKYYEIVTVQIQYASYKTKVQILNNFLQNHIHNEGELGGYGAFGNVYFLRFQHQNYAVKCIRFNTVNNFEKKENLFDRQQVLMTVLKQYFFILLFSALQMGPKVRKIMGFDLVVSEECIQFSTQICINKQIKAVQRKNLRDSLKLMHTMKIVHRDIKPDNIMYSQSYNKHVFIDFGGCMALKERVGQKTFTGFLGTTGFCSDEMLSLLGNNKSYVDLYFNDLYGLNISFQRQKQHSKNLVQKVIVQQSQYALETIKISNNHFCLLNLIKYFIYNQYYNDFQLYWRLIQKKYIGFLEELQIQLLRFFMDIQPNKTLKQFYWKNIEQPIRTDPEFQNLNQYFSHQLTDALALWKLFPSKEKKFSKIVYFYRKLEINHGNFDKKDKNIMKIQLTKYNIENYIFCFKNIIQGKSKQISSQTKKEFLKEFHHCTQIETYFLNTVNYCTFVQNKYDAKFQMKVWASEIANFLIETIFKETYKNIDEIFICVSQQVKSLVKMFQYFIIYFWHKIPEIFKQTSMTNCISSLFLLGFPIYLDEAKHQLGFYLLKQNQNTRVQKILRFWQFNLILLNFGNLFYNRNYENYLYLSSAEQKKTIQQFYYDIMCPQSEQNDEFYRVNNYFYLKIYLDHQKLNEFSLKQAFDKLEADHNFRVIKGNDLSKWKVIMRIVLTFLATAYEIHYHFLDFTHINEYNRAVLKNDIDSLPYLFAIPSTKYEVWSSFNKLNQIVKIIDRIINHEDVSLRYFTSSRILIAYRTKNYKLLKNLIQIILKNTKNFSILNMFIMHQQLRVVKQLVFHQFKENQNINFIEKSKFFLPLLTRGIQMGSFYSDMKNMLNPLARLQDDTSRELKNVLMVVSTLHLLLHNIRMMIQNILAFYSKRKSLPFSFKSTDFLNQEIYQIHEKNLKIVKNSLQSLVNNINVVPYLQNDRDSKNQCVVYLMNYFINQRQFQKAQKLFQSQFDTIETLNIDDQQERVKPVLNILIIYCILRTRSSGQSLMQYQKLLKIYWNCRKKDFQLDPFKYPLFFTYFFTGMIYCLRSFQQIQELLHFLTECLRIAPSKENAQKFKTIIESRMWCNCQQCFIMPRPKWDPLNFVKFLEQKINKYDKIKDSYMSFIFYFCLENRNLSLKSKKKFIEFIRKSINYLSHSIRKIVTNRLHFYSLDYYNLESELNIHLQNFKNQIKLQPKLTKFQILAKQSIFLQKLRQNFSEKIIKKHIHYYLSHVKHHNKFHSLEDTIERQFFYKQNLLYNFRLPQLIKENYQQKLMKYHFIGQNYRQTYPPSQYQIEMTKIYFERQK